MTPPTEAQAPTPEPSELRNLLERAKPHASSHALVYGHRGIIGELIDALEARALSPSADTRMGEVDIRKQAISLLDQHSNYMNGISHGQRHIPTEFALRAVEAALSTTRLAASSREGGENLRSALEAAVRDLEATYEAAKSGKPIETSIGQFGRLSRMKAALASPAPMPETCPTCDLPKSDPVGRYCSNGFHLPDPMPETEVEQVTQALDRAVAALHPAWFSTDYNHREAVKAVRRAALGSVQERS